MPSKHSRRVLVKKPMNHQRKAGVHNAKSKALNAEFITNIQNRWKVRHYMDAIPMNLRPKAPQYGILALQNLLNIAQRVPDIKVAQGYMRTQAKKVRGGKAGALVFRNIIKELKQKYGPQKRQAMAVEVEDDDEEEEEEEEEESGSEYEEVDDDSEEEENTTQHTPETRGTSSLGTSLTSTNPITKKDKDTQSIPFFGTNSSSSSTHIDHASPSTPSKAPVTTPSISSAHDHAGLISPPETPVASHMTLLPSSCTPPPLPAHLVNAHLIKIPYIRKIRMVQVKSFLAHAKIAAIAAAKQQQKQSLMVTVKVYMEGRFKDGVPPEMHDEITTLIDGTLDNFGNEMEKICQKYEK